MVKFFSMKNAVVFSFAVLFAAAAGAANLFCGDTGAEAGIDFVTLGGYGSRLVPAVRDTANAFEGKSSLRINWVQKQQIGNTRHWLGRYIGINTPELEKNCDYTVSFYARACADDYPLGVHLFANGGWTKDSSYYLSAKLSKEWKRYSFTFRPRYAGTAPSKCYSLNLLLPRNAKLPDGPVWFDAFQIEKGSRATAYESGQAAAVDTRLESGKPMHVINRNDKISSAVNAVVLKGSGRTTLELTVRDWQGNVVKRYTVPLKNSLRKNFELPSDRYGWFIATARVLAGDAVLAEEYNTYIVVRPPVKIAPGCRAFMGVITTDVYTEDTFAAMRAMGVSRIQVNVRKLGHLSHGLLGPGKYDFSGADFWVNSANKYGMAVKLGGIGPFDWPLSCFTAEEVKEMKQAKERHPMLGMRHRRMYGDFIRQIADRYAGKVETFDVGTEDNGRLGISPYFKKKYPEGVQKDKNGTPWVVAGPAFDTLCTLLIDAAKILKERTPAGTRIACIRPSQGRPGNEWFFVWKEFERIGRYYNSFSIDTYSMVPYYIHKKYPRNMRSGGGPDGRFFTKAHAQRMIDKFGNKDMDIFLSETGVSLFSMELPLSPEHQEAAEYTVRDMIAAKCAGITSYDLFRGPTEHPNSIGFSFFANSQRGLHIRNAAFSALAQVLENVVETKWITPDKDTRLAFLKHADGSGVCAVWSKKGTAMRIPEGVELYDIMGNKCSIPADRTLELSETVYYFAHQKYDVLLKKLASPGIEQTDLCTVMFRRMNMERGLLKFTNNSNTDVLSLDVVIKNDGMEKVKRVLNVPAASWNSIGFKLPASVKNVEVSCRRAGSRSKAMTVNFTMNQYTGIASGSQPQSVMGQVESRTDILPDEPWTPWSGKNDLSAVLYGSWDEEYLHLKAVVRDDIHNPSKDKYHPWNGDSMQFALDPGNNGGFFVRIPGLPLDRDDIEAGIMAGRNGEQHLEMSAGRELPNDIRYTATRDEKAKNVVYTIDIPWKKLDVKPYKGMPFGLSAVFFDDDTGNGKDYYGFIGQGVTGRFKNPGKYKKFYLQ